MTLVSKVSDNQLDVSEALIYLTPTGAANDLYGLHVQDIVPA